MRQETVPVSEDMVELFQSQTRSRSTCDMRHFELCMQPCRGFNLRREAAPHATESRVADWPVSASCFNLRREAAPHATEGCCELKGPVSVFQSQTRSRSTCDQEQSCMSNNNSRSFNLRREAAPHATRPAN